MKKAGGNASAFFMSFSVIMGEFRADGLNIELTNFNLWQYGV